MLRRYVNKLKCIITVVATISLIVGLNDTLSLGYEDTAILYKNEDKVIDENIIAIEQNSVKQVDNSNIVSIDNGLFETASGYSLSILLLKENMITANTISEDLISKDILSEELQAEAITPGMTEKIKEEEIKEEEITAGIDTASEEELETYVFVLTGSAIEAIPNVSTGSAIETIPNASTGSAIETIPNASTGSAIIAVPDTSTGSAIIAVPGPSTGDVIETVPGVLTGEAIDVVIIEDEEDNKVIEEEELQKRLEEEELQKKLEEEEIQKKLEEEELQKKLEEEELKKKLEEEELKKKMDLEAPLIIINNNQMQDSKLYIPYHIPVNIVESGINISGLADIYYTINGGDIKRPNLIKKEYKTNEETKSSILCSGSFEILLNRAGEYTISVTAVDRKGNERTAEYKVKLEEDNPIISIVMPTTFDIIIDPYEVAGKGRIYSSTVKIMNFSNRDIKLSIKSTELNVKRDQNEAAKECNLYMVEVNKNEPVVYNNINHITVATKSIPIREGSTEVNEVFQLSKAFYSEDNVLQSYDDSSVYAFQVIGNISENSEDNWTSGDIKISVVYEFEVMSRSIR